MSLLVPDVGEDKFLANIVNKTAAQDLQLRLFQSDTTPAEGDTASTYTQATFTGYVALTLTGASWTVASGVASYAQQVFTSTAGSQNQPIYGFYLVGASDGVLRLAERFPDGPYPIMNNGDAIKVTPRITLD